MTFLNIPMICVIPRNRIYRIFFVPQWARCNEISFLIIFTRRQLSTFLFFPICFLLFFCPNFSFLIRLLYLCLSFSFSLINCFISTCWLVSLHVQHVFFLHYSLVNVFCCPVVKLHLFIKCLEAFELLS